MQLFGHKIGLDQPFFLIAGPCVIESEELQMRTAERLKAITDKLGILLFFKSSFDKANRSSGTSYRGPGMDEGLKILAKVRAEVGVPVLTDVHDVPQIAPVASVLGRNAAGTCDIPPYTSMPSRWLRGRLSISKAGSMRVPSTTKRNRQLPRPLV